MYFPNILDDLIINSSTASTPSSTMYARRLEPSCVVEELDDKSDASWELVGSKSHSRSHSSTSLSTTQPGPAAPPTPDTQQHLDNDNDATILHDTEQLHDALEHVPGGDVEGDVGDGEQYLSCTSDEEEMRCGTDCILGIA